MAAPKAMNYKVLEIEDFSRFAKDDRWVAEQKLDGDRCIITIRKSGGLVDVGFHGRNGEVLKHSAAEQHFETLAEELTDIWTIAHDVILDGELMPATGEYWAFDLLELNGTSCMRRPFSERRQLLEAILNGFDRLEKDGRITHLRRRVHLLPQSVGGAAKLALFAAVDAAGAEGLMVKRLDGTYHEGKRTADGLKVKFVKTADVIVTGRNVGDSGGAKGGSKENAELAVFDAEGRLVPIGRCSMIGKIDAQVGDVIEVKFLYLGAGNRVYQPRLMRLRPDKSPNECLMDQFTPMNREIL
jgi:ATP-dependent DNA ligase